jgi:hypothetical protein
MIPLVYKPVIAGWVKEYKNTHPCVKCGESNPVCLIFHHRDPSTKKFNVGMRTTNVVKDELVEEMKKCDVMCLNCHAKLHNKTTYGHVKEHMREYIPNTD